MLTVLNRYPSKNEVSSINQARLAALKTPIQVFISRDLPGQNSKGFALDEGQAQDCLDRNTIWPQELSVKVGAMVMLVTVSSTFMCPRLTNLCLRI